jgi:hypothetical protein
MLKHNLRDCDAGNCSGYGKCDRVLIPLIGRQRPYHEEGARYDSDDSYPHRYVGT